MAQQSGVAGVNEVQPSVVKAVVDMLVLVRFSVRMAYGYLSTFIYKLQPRLTSSLPAPMAVDAKMRIYLNWEHLKKRSVPDVCAIFVHELLHVVLQHFTRQGNRTAMVKYCGRPTSAWNLACDCAVNSIILNGWNKFPLPKDATQPSTFGFPENLLAETYYDLLMKEAEKNGKSDEEDEDEDGEEGTEPGDEPGEDEGDDGGGDDGEEGDDDGEGPVGGNGGKPTNKPPKDPKPGESKKPKPADKPKDKPDPKPSDPSKVSKVKPGTDPGPVTENDVTSPAKDGKPRPWEDEADADPDTPGVKEWEKEMADRDMAQKINDDVKKGIGKIPGGLSRWADSVLTPQVNWSREFAMALVKAVTYIRGMKDFTYTKLHKRTFIDKGVKVLFPGMHAPEVTVGVIFDTSGSMGSDDLAYGLAEVKAVLKAINAGVIFMSCDAMVHNIDKVKNARQLKLQGGGGTDMRVAYKAMADMGKKCPAIIICITDGESPWPEERIKNTLNFIVLINNYRPSYLPTWARIFPIKKSDKL